MMYQRIICGAALAAMVFGAGCVRGGSTAPKYFGASSGSVVGGGQGAPANATDEFKHASTQIEVVQATIPFDTDAPSVSMNVPKAWIGNEVIWTPTADDKKNHLRVAAVSGSAEQAWEDHQKLDVYQVVDAEKTSQGFLLIANHPTLHATIIKYFVPNPSSSQKYYLIDCLIDYTQDRAVSLSACKAGVDSFDISSW
ncbi:MAG: hypothetical protein WC477_03255 [Patescibacteria group bacterium]